VLEQRKDDDNGWCA